jgi:hypothetical protein
LRRDGLAGVLERRTLPHRRGKTSIAAHVPVPLQQQIVRLALAPPFTARERARIVQTCHALAIDYRGIQQILALHPLSPEVLQLHHQTLQQTHLPPCAASQQLPLALEPTAHAQRLVHA